MMRPLAAPGPAVGRPVAGARATLVCLVWTLGTGVLLGVKSAAPALGVRWLPMQVLQPWHALGAMAFLIAGAATLLCLACRRMGDPATALEWLVTPITGVLLLAGGLGIAIGQGSGLEYLVWPRGLSAAPLGLLALLAWTAWRRLDGLCRASPEGAWLLVMGATLALLGMIERLLGSEMIEPTRALMIEWHAMDTIFAGLNTSLYGLAILCSPPVGAGRPLRSRWLYVVAVIALLSTFGHHHYGSAQPALLKWLALGGSLLGMVSFVRHLAMLRRARPSSTALAPADPLASAAGAWTLFAVGTGVLLAIPQINHLLHGTHAIVAHSMGAIIGVNVAIILAGVLGADGRGDPARARCVRRASWSMQVALALITLDLAVAGFCKGLSRLEGSHHENLSVVRAVLLPLPLLGLWLAASLSHLGWVAWGCRLPDPPHDRAARAQARPNPAVATGNNQ